MKLLDSKRIIITGGNQGIGFSVAKKCVEAGAQVIIVARDKNNLNDALKELNNLPGVMNHQYRLDVSDLKAVQRFGEWLDENKLKVNGLVNCAGVYGPIGKITEIDVKDFEKTIKINFLGTVYLCAIIGSRLTPNTRKKIINFSGGGAASPFPNYSAYATSKVAIVRLTENISIELEGEEFDINCIAPGFVVTRLHQNTLSAGPKKSGEAFFENTKQQIEKGGVSPDIAADLSVFLLSEKSNGINGKFISAPWDPWRDKKFQNKLLSDRDFASLRRIDGKYFDKL